MNNHKKAQNIVIIVNRDWRNAGNIFYKKNSIMYGQDWNDSEVEDYSDEEEITNIELFRFLKKTIVSPPFIGYLHDEIRDPSLLAGQKDYRPLIYSTNKMLEMNPIADPWKPLWDTVGF